MQQYCMRNATDNLIMYEYVRLDHFLGQIRDRSCTPKTIPVYAMAVTNAYNTDIDTNWQFRAGILFILLDGGGVGGSLRAVVRFNSFSIDLIDRF